MNVYVYMYVYICIYIYIYIYMNIYICIFELYISICTYLFQSRPYRHDALLEQSTKTVRFLDEKMESFTTRMVKQQKVGLTSFDMYICMYIYIYMYTYIDRF
jgi:hypothetical protein